MAFPITPLPLTVWHAPGADPVDLSTWNWSEITSDVRAGEGVQIAVGRSDEGAQVGATRTGLTIDNRTGNYSPRNPNGANYGLLAKGTPIIVAVTRVNDTFTRSGALGSDADSGLAWSTVGGTWATTGSAATSALGSANTFNQATIDGGGHDVDVTHTSSISAVATGAAWVDATIVRYIDDNNFYRLHTEFQVGGTIGCKIVRTLAGVSTDLVSITSTGVSYSAGTVIKTRVRAIGARLQIRAWLNSGSEPTTWTCEADDDALTGTQVGLYEWRVFGNTNAGSMTCTIGNFRSDVVRAITPVPEWPVRWDKSGNNVTAPIAGAGILRRLSQGQSALRSPMYRQLSLWSPAGFWPLEDGSDSTAASSAVARVAAATCTDVTFGATGPPGAAGAVTLNAAASKVVGLTPNAPTTATGYAAMFMFKQQSAAGADSTLALWSATGTVATWQLITAAGGSVKLFGYGADGATVVSSGAVVWGAADPTQWVAIQLETEVSGGTVNWALTWNSVTSPSFVSTFGSYAGTAGRLLGVTLTGTAGCSYSMSWLGENTLPFVTSTFAQVESGFAGELAGDRLVRLCAEEGIPLTVIGDTADTAAMGVQTPAALLDLLRECEVADQGVLHERGAGLGYLTHAQKYAISATSATMGLDFASGHIAEPPEPTDDDQRLRNRIRLRRPGGVGEVTAQDDDSIAASGVYADDLTANLATDDALVDHASWRLHLGTYDELRWPRIVLNLARSTSLITSWLKVQIGSRITIANPPDEVAGGVDLDLIVEGWTETLSSYRWDVELVCSPAKPWNVGAADDGTIRWDSASTTLKADATSGATSVTFRTANINDLWSTTHTPYDVTILGQVNTVTAMGAASLVSGAYDQAATLTRGVNGVTKALTAGAEIHIATPGRWAL